MIARLRQTQSDPETFSPSEADTDSDMKGFKASRVMGGITADYDRGILTLRGSVRTFRERQFVQDAYTALAERQPVLNLIEVVGLRR